MSSSSERWLYLILFKLILEKVISDRKALEINLINRAFYIPVMIKHVLLQPLMNVFCDFIKFYLKAQQNIYY